MFRCATVNVKKQLRTIEHKLHYHCAVALPAKVLGFLNAQPTHSMRTECSTTSYPSNSACFPAFKAHLRSPPSSRIQSSLYCFHLISPFFFFVLSSAAPFLQRLWTQWFSFQNFLLLTLLNAFFIFCPSAISWWFSVFILNIRTPNLGEKKYSPWMIRGGGGIKIIPKVKMHRWKLWVHWSQREFCLVFSKIVISVGMMISFT